jgi:hypothetical protein
MKSKRTVPSLLENGFSIAATFAGAAMGIPRKSRSCSLRTGVAHEINRSSPGTGETAKSWAGGRDAVIRQAISCDICASEKKQTNHWFVAYEQAGELRVSGWSSRNRLRPGSKHLCGQTCLHKLVDEFFAKALAMRPPAISAEEAAAEMPRNNVDTSLTSSSAYEDVRLSYEETESSARVVTPPASGPANRPALRPVAELVPATPRPRAEESDAPPPADPAYSTRNWRVEAWKRERERESRSGDRRPSIASRRRFS